MPFRTRETLESWLQEFVSLGYAPAGTARVVPQDGDGGANTGLVIVGFTNASTATSVQPSEEDPTRWLATMEPREDAVVLDAAQLLNLSTELATLSALCGFLQAKARAFPRPDPLP